MKEHAYLKNVTLITHMGASQDIVTAQKLTSLISVLFQKSFVFIGVKNVRLAFEMSGGTVFLFECFNAWKLV